MSIYQAVEQAELCGTEEERVHHLQRVKQDLLLVQNYMERLEGNVQGLAQSAEWQRIKEEMGLTE